MIVSDSLRAIQDLGRGVFGNFKTTPLIQDIYILLDKYNRLNLGEIKFLWIPAHVGT